MMVLKKKINNKEVELLIIKFMNASELIKRILNNIIKGNNLDSKPRVKHKSHAKRNIDWNEVKKKQN